MVTSPATLISTQNSEAFSNAEDCSKHEHHATAGTKAHWAMTYLGGDWILNSTFGVAFAYFASRTHFGREVYSKHVTDMFTSVAKPFIKTPETLSKVVGGATDFLNIMFGGTVINPLLTHLEKHENKKAISKKFDELIYGKERVANDPKFQQAYDEIDHQAKKDTKSAWAARFIALAPLIAASSTPQVNEFFKSNQIPLLKYINFDNISKFTRTTAEKIGIHPQKMIAETHLNSQSGKVTNNWQALHDLIGFDFGYTIYYALIHSAAFTAAAKIFETNHEKNVERRAEEAAHRVNATSALSEEFQPAQSATTAAVENAEKPSTSVSNITEHARTVAVESTAQLA